MVYNTPIPINHGGLLARNLRQSPLDIIKKHLSQDGEFKVIQTKFPPLVNVFGQGLDDTGQAEGSPYVQGLKFFVRDEKGGGISQKTYADIRSINRQNKTANIVGIVELNGDVYGVQDEKPLLLFGENNEATFNRKATRLGTLFTDSKDNNTLRGAKLKKLN